MPSRWSAWRATSCRSTWASRPNPHGQFHRVFTPYDDDGAEYEYRWRQMYRVDPKQAVLEHVSKQSEAGPAGRTLSPQAEVIIAAPIERGYSGAVIVGMAQA